MLGYLVGKLRDAMMVVLTISLVIGNAVLTAALKVLHARGEEWAHRMPPLDFFLSGLGRTIAQLVAYGFSVLLFYLVYRHSSPRRLPRRAAFAGSVFTAVLFELAKRAFAWYLDHVAAVSRFSTDANIGAAILFVLWLYYTALVLADRSGGRRNLGPVEPPAGGRRRVPRPPTVSVPPAQPAGS